MYLCDFNEDYQLQRTGNFESLLSRRFVGVTLKQYEAKRREAAAAAERGSGNPFEEEDAIEDPNNPFFEKKKKDNGEGSTGRGNEKTSGLRIGFVDFDLGLSSSL